MRRFAAWMICPWQAEVQEVPIVEYGPRLAIKSSRRMLESAPRLTVFWRCVTVLLVMES